jgi:hypothetical protein
MYFTENLKSKAEQTQQRHPSQAAAEASATVDQPKLKHKRSGRKQVSQIRLSMQTVTLWTCSEHSL